MNVHPVYCNIWRFRLYSVGFVGHKVNHTAFVKDLKIEDTEIMIFVLHGFYTKISLKNPEFSFFENIFHSEV